MDLMVKKLVRLALASEYSRQPIRRADIGNKGMDNSSIVTSRGQSLVVLMSSSTGST